MLRIFDAAPGGKRLYNFFNIKDGLINYFRPPNISTKILVIRDIKKIGDNGDAI